MAEAGLRAAAPARAAGIARERLLRRLGLAFAAVLLWILAYTLVDPHYSFAQPSRLPALALAALGVTAVVAWGPRLARLADRWEAHPRTRRRVLLTLLAVVLLLEVGLSYAAAVRAGFDAVVIDGMARLRATGAELPEDYLTYNGHFPNNLFLVAVLTTWYHAWVDQQHSWDLALAVLNPAALVTAVTLAYLTARRVAGALAGYLVLVPATVLLLVSPWLGVVYSDVQGTVYPIAIAYLFLRQADAASPRTRAGWWAAIGLLAGVGMAIKPTVIFALAAAIAVAVLGWQASRWRESLAGISLLLVLPCSLGLLVAGAATDLLEGHAGLTPTGAYADEQFPPTHHLMTGAQVDGSGPYRGYGGWEANDAAFTTALPAGPERFWGPVRVYRDRVAALGPVGYAVFLNHKANWIFADSTFYSCCEGAMGSKPSPFTHDDGVSAFVQQFLGRYAPHYPITWTMWHTAWLITLALCCVPLVRRGRVLRPDGQAVLQLGLIGLLVFLLFFEGRSRFLYLYLPYFLVLAASGATLLAHRGRSVPGPR